MESINSSMPEQPFKGIKSFRYLDRNIFAGRDDKLSSLIDLILVYRGIMVYGQSGIGKSSLVAAGLIPKLLEEDFQPEIIRVYPNIDSTFIINRITKQANPLEYLPSIFDKETNEEKIALSFEEFQSTVIKNATVASNTESESDDEKIPVLIFDQFEELITLFEEATQKSDKPEIVKERLDLQLKIITLLKNFFYNQKLRVKIILIFREDYLAKFSRLINLIPDLRDHYLRIKPLKIDGLTEIIEKPFKLPFPKPFSASFINLLKSKFEEYFGSEDVSLTEVQIACLYLYELENEEQRLQILNKENPIKNILETYNKSLLDKFSPAQKLIATDILSLLVLNDKTRNVFPLSSIINSLETSYAEKDITTVLDILENDTRIIRKELRKDGLYYEISSEVLIPYINEQKIKKEQEVIAKKKEEEALQKEKERKRRLQRNILIAVVSIGAVAILISWMQAKNIKNKNNEIINMAMLFKANQYLQDGDLGKAFGIYGYLDSIGSGFVKNQIRKIKINHTDLPGKIMITMANNYVRCQIDDSTYEIWKVASNNSFALQQTFSKVKLRAYTHNYLAIYANDHLSIFNALTGNTYEINKELLATPYFAFSSYTDYFVYALNRDLYIMDLKDTNITFHFTIDSMFQKSFKNVLTVTKSKVVSYYDDYLITWANTGKDSLARKGREDYLDTSWFALNGDSILLVDKNGLTTMHLNSNLRQVHKENFNGYEISKPADSLLFLYSYTAHSTDNDYDADNSSGDRYNKVAFYNLNKHKFFPVFDKGAYNKMSVNKDYSRCLLTDELGYVHLIDNNKMQSSELKNSSTWKAYDISDDGNYLAYVIEKEESKKDSAKTDSSKRKLHADLFYLYDLSSDSATQIDEIFRDSIKNASDIYGSYYFRFNSSSDKIAYVKPIGDSTVFVVRNINDKKIIYSSPRVTKIFDDGNKTDFTADYIHVYTNDEKEGIILLNSQERTPVYYSKFYPKIGKQEWDELVKELNLGL